MLISVSGEVLNPTTLQFRDDMTYLEYIDRVGGFSKYADKNGIYVIRANGESELLVRGLFEKGNYPQPGDTIVVPRNYDQINALPLISVATGIIADIAFASASLNAISN